MRDTTRQLSISLDRSENTELARLGHRCTATAKMLAAHAVRQMLAAARGDATLAVPTLDPAEGPKADAGVTVTLQAIEAAALDALAVRLNATPEALGRATVLGMLDAAKNGAMPMVKAVRTVEPVDVFAGSAERRASCNFEKARLTVDKLTLAVELGVDPNNPRAHLEFMATLGDMQTFEPG